MEQDSSLGSHIIYRPEPAAGEETYRRELESALNYSKKRRENYEEYQRSSRATARPNYRPIRLDIENVSRCNFRCGMCQVSDYKKMQRAGDMSLEQFRELIDEEYGLVEIKLTGIGEPLMQGDDYFKMIRYARSKSIWVRIVTNASLLHIKENYKKLVDSDVNEIQISIDGSTKEIYENIRRGANFEKVKENCRLINDYCRKKNKSITKMWTVVQSDNQDDLANLVRLGGELGFPIQVFCFDFSSWGQDKWLEHNDRISVDHKFAHHDKEQLVQLGISHGIKVRFWRIQKFSTSSEDTLCPWPFERAFVSSDLRTVPCCMIGNPDAFELEKGKSFKDAWQGEGYSKFRQAHLEGNIPKVCKPCYME